MNKPLTIKQLHEECEKQIKAGRGDYAIMLSNDDEGNGYHYCWYTFITVEELIESDPLICDFIGDEVITPMDKTIILG